jgi:hypothetical protein
MDPFSNEVIAGSFVPLHCFSSCDTKYLFSQMAGGTHPASAKSIPVFFPKHFIWKSCLANFLRLCLTVQSTYFQSTSFGPSIKKRASKVTSNLAQKLQPQTEASFSFLAKNLQEFYLRCFHTGLFYIVIINI